METTVYNLQGQETGKINLPAIFETKVSPALLHEVVTGYLANQRAGTHSTKTRAEVSGGSKKPWKQKGTGNARAGSIRSPLWRKGGIAFGPKPRDYSQGLTQQKRRRSLEMALTIKAQENSILVVDGVAVSEPKTKKMVEILKNLKVGSGNVLLVVDKIEKNLKIASRNIEGLVIIESNNLNAYQVLWAKKIVLTQATVEKLK
jgi:large subunit ribosomal protein L4